MPLVYDPITNNPKFVQTDFSGGMNLYQDDTKIGDNEYREAFFLRNRSGSLEPVKKALLLTAPTGKKQGIYGFDTFFVLFVAGKAYFQVIGTSTWVRIPNFQMDASVDFIYAEAVPASTINFRSNLQSSNTFQGTALDTKVDMSNITISGTPAGLICQDGINQPRIIFADKSTRVLQTYDQWSQDDDKLREYVPVGKQMKYHPNGILFIASPDGKFLYRSVSGRPLDFVVNIDTNGNKGGDATTTDYAVSYNPITCISFLNTGELFVGTTLGCYVITLDYTSLIFGEPEFTNTGTIIAAVTNHFSFIDILGDYGFIDYSGMRSFNAVKVSKNEGRNSIFSLRIGNILKRIVQSPLTTASAIFQDYGYFGVQTTFGYGLLVYDTITQTWSSFDSTPEPIKMLTTTTIQSTPRLFGISDNNVYEFESQDSIDYNRAAIKYRGCIIGDSQQELKTSAIRATFLRSDSEEQAIAISYVDEKKLPSVNYTLSDTRGPITYPADYPVEFSGLKKIDNARFDLGGIQEQGYKLSTRLSWPNAAILTQIQIDAEVIEAESSIGQQDKVYANTD